jgi:hypothetical protein
MHRALILTAAFIALTTSPAWAAQTQQFDLVCSGTITTDGETKPASSTLSVNGVTKRWCYRDSGCAMTFGIASMTPIAVQLLAVKTPLNEVNFLVDLKTEKYTETIIIPGHSKSSMSGVCKMAPFTPFE